MTANPRFHAATSLRAIVFIGATCMTVLGAGCSSGSSSGPGSPPLASGGNVAGVGGSTSGQGGQIGQSGGAPGPSSSGASGAAAAASRGGAGIGGVGGGASSGGAAPIGGVAGVPDGGGVDGGACCATQACQPSAVQACVCTDWHQSQCCTGPWDAICQTTAEEKCGAPHCATGPVTDPSKGACCATHASAGCSDTATETCVCGLLPDCCDKAWDAVCVQLVREEHCETGVRDCVCTTWQQSTCCDSSWTDVCGIVAEDKCGAKHGCP